MVCGYEVRTSCEESPSVTPDGTASVITVEAVCIYVHHTFTKHRYNVIVIDWLTSNYDL